MLRGVASMLELNPNIESRIQQIATPNGMTAAGLDTMRSHKLSQIVLEASEATLKKAKSL
jgi:pyrroline-5-carboxylate reductase